MSFSSLLNATMNVYASVETVDAYGGQTHTRVLSYAKRPCRVDTLSNEKQAILSRAGVVATHNIFCDPITVNVGDEIQVPTTGTTYYRVINVLDREAAGPLTHHMTLLTRTPS